MEKLVGEYHMNNYSTLKNLALKREGFRKRISSYDRDGGNNDFIILPSDSTKKIAEISGSGCITHIWMTLGEFPVHKEKNYLRQIILRMWWDDETEPSVEVPIGDFFGMGHARTKNFNSLPLNMSPEDGRSFNCFFAMPFSTSARIEVQNEYNNPVRMYFYIDYESYQDIHDRYLRFHACWRRTNPCNGISDENLKNERYQFGGYNKSGKGNYLILEAEGQGHYIGCHLDITNLRQTSKWNWYGEGDDMIFIDGEEWPPSLHGTGTEDYFNTAWCPTQDICNPYHGVILPGRDNFAGQITLYRYHIEDPIIFHKSIRVTIEHGHNNQRSDDYSSTAYWYQEEPHKKFEKLLPSEERLPIPEVIGLNMNELKKYINM